MSPREQSVRVCHIEPRFAFLGASCIGKRLGPIKIMEGYARGRPARSMSAHKAEKIEKAAFFTSNYMCTYIYIYT